MHIYPIPEIFSQAFIFPRCSFWLFGDICGWKGILLDNIRLPFCGQIMAFILMFAYTSVNFRPLFFRQFGRYNNWIYFQLLCNLFVSEIL